MKIWKIAVVITLVVALVLGVTIPGLAASGNSTPQTGKLTSKGESPAWCKNLPRIIRGEVTDIGSSSFDISNGESESTIYVTEDTKFFMGPVPIMAMHRWQWCSEQANMPPPMSAMSKAQPDSPQSGMGRANGGTPSFMSQRPEFAPNLLQLNNGQGMMQGIRARLAQLRPLCEEANFDDLNTGDRVVVLLTLPVGDTLTTEVEERLTAQMVYIIKPSVWERVAGTIESLSDDSIAIKPASGDDTVTLTYDENTIFTLKGFTSVETEQFAHAVYNTETMMAKVIKVWPEEPILPQPTG